MGHERTSGHSRALVAIQYKLSFLIVSLLSVGVGVRHCSSRIQ